MADKNRKTVAAKQDQFFLPPFPGFDSALIARAGEILSDAATEVWSRELELMRLEAELATRSFMPLHANGSDTKNKVEEWQDGAEKVIAQMRSVSDSLRDCSWKLFELYSKNALQAPPNGREQNPG